MVLPSMKWTRVTAISTRSFWARKKDLLLTSDHVPRRWCDIYTRCIVRNFGTIVRTGLFQSPHILEYIAPPGETSDRIHDDFASLRCRQKPLTIQHVRALAANPGGISSSSMTTGEWLDESDYRSMVSHASCKQNLCVIPRWGTWRVCAGHAAAAPPLARRFADGSFFRSMHTHHS